MRPNVPRIAHSLAAAAFAMAISVGAAAADLGSPTSGRLGNWALTVYGGVGTDGGIEDFPGLDADFNDAYMGAAALSRELARWRDSAALEVEGQVAQHFRKQDHAEGNLLLVARWLDFPWNGSVRTSVAIGEGVSYATSVPEIERERSPDKTSRLLNYMLLELELAPPDEERWSFVTRIHHRSGVFGLYDGVSKGSNILGAGLKYRF